jgi:pimeloyl-ACP methyl ester carboxylesterase
MTAPAPSALYPIGQLLGQAARLRLGRQAVLVIASSVGGLVAQAVVSDLVSQLVEVAGLSAWRPGLQAAYGLIAAAGLLLGWRFRKAIASCGCPPSDAATTPKRARRAPVVAVLSAIAIAMAGCQSVPRDMRVAELGDHHLAYRVLGAGRPALVMISGLGDGMDSFRAAAPLLAQNATVIVYDRAGYGSSSRPGALRDAAAAERELLEMLRASDVPGPYVLLGHSLGGLFAEYFAARHPELVAGLILEETRPADFGTRCEAAGINMCGPTPAMMILSPQGAQAEVAALSQTLAEVSALPAPSSNLRVLVLSRPIRRNDNPFDAMWARAQRDLAQHYGATHRNAPAGGHYIHIDQQAWFVAAVGDFLRTTDGR